MAMVEAGLGVSIPAELVLHRTNYHLAIRPTVPTVSRTIAAGYREKNRLPIAGKRLISFLAQCRDELP